MPEDKKIIQVTPPEPEETAGQSCPFMNAAIVKQGQLANQGQIEIVTGPCMLDRCGLYNVRRRQCSVVGISESLTDIALNTVILDTLEAMTPPRGNKPFVEAPVEIWDFFCKACSHEWRLLQAPTDDRGRIETPDCPKCGKPDDVRRIERA